MCKAVICLDCVRYTVVRRKTLHREYFESIPVCKNCLPEERMRRKLMRIVSEVLKEED